MIFNNVVLTVTRESDISSVTELLAEQARLSRTEPGCARFEVYHSQTNPHFFMLIEQWESQDHLDRHREAKAFQELYVPKVIPLVTREPHPSDLIWPATND
jgi:quinol monooxygenase YgiN